MTAHLGHNGAMCTLLDKYPQAVDAKFNGYTALGMAAWSGHEETVDILLGRGADVSEVGTWGRTALMNAALWGHTEVVRVLLNHGAGAHIDLKDDQGRTALMLAQERKMNLKPDQEELVALLATEEKRMKKVLSPSLHRNLPAPPRLKSRKYG